MNLTEVRADLESALAGPERDVEQYAGLRAALDAVPADQRGRHWRETSLLTELAFRQRPARARKLLRRMQERRGPRFERFWGECQRALAPYTLGPHGYALSLGSRDEEAVWREVAAILSALRGLGHEAFVVSGTLLGLVRDGGLIGHDDDVDLAVLLGSSDEAAVAEEWNAFRVRLGEAGLLDPDFDNFGKHHCKVLVHGGVGVDLFPAWLADGRVFVWPHTHGELAVADLLPLDLREVAGSVVALPRRPEPMLELNYGPDWRSPDPTYRFDWAAAKERFASFLMLLGTADEESYEPDEEDDE